MCCKHHAAERLQIMMPLSKSELKSLGREWLSLASVPKAQKELAYRWELDRWMLRKRYNIPAWTELSGKQRETVRKVCGKKCLWGDVPAEAARFLLGVGELERFMLHEMKHEDRATSAWCVHVMRMVAKNQKEAGEQIDPRYHEDELIKRLPHDADGWGQVAFRYDPKRPLDEIMADMRKEMEMMRPFPAKPMKPRGKDWGSRLIDLLCHQAKRQHALEWKEAAPLIDPCIKAAGCGGSLGHKSWLTRLQRAYNEIRHREDWLDSIQREKLPRLPPEVHAEWMDKPISMLTLPYEAAIDLWGERWTSVICRDDWKPFYFRRVTNSAVGRGWPSGE